MKTENPIACVKVNGKVCENRGSAVMAFSSELCE
jgi:hypothetical protein